MVLAKYGPGDTASANHLDNLLADPGVSMASRFATAIYMLGYGLRLLILPFPLVSDYSYNAMPVTGFTNPLVIISVLVFVAMAVFGVRRVLARRLAPSAFAAVYYLVTISVFSNLFLLIGSNFGERFLFFPSVGFCLAVGFLLAKILDGTLMGVTLTKNNGTAWAILALMVTVYGYLSVVRNADWVSNLTLAGADVAKSPNSARLNYNYGIELERSLEVGQADKARQQVVRTEALGYLEKAYSLYPSFEFIHDQMGVMYRRNGQGAQAIEHLSAAIKIDARDSVATNELAEIYFNGKQYQQSIDLNRGALYLNANKAAVCTHIAAAFGLMSRYDSATAYLYKAIALNPGYNAAYGNLAFIYNAMNLPDSVQKYRQLAQTPKR